MRTVRRIYFYAVAAISLEAVLWGLIVLARSIFCSAGALCSGLDAVLAQGLALVIVGLPIFAFHWLGAQRFARQELDERAAGIRAAFLYGLLLGTLIPVVQNFLALLNRPALTVLRLESSRALAGGTQTWSDNLIAILLNLLVAAYFLQVLRSDWQVIQPSEAFASLRRLYRWSWSLYGLGLTVTGLIQVLRFLLSTNAGLMNIDLQRYWAVNGVLLTLVGVPVWVSSWLTLQRSLREQPERESLLRTGLLYLLSLVGAVIALAAGGYILDALLRLLFGVVPSGLELIRRIDSPLAVGIPFLGIWLYHRRWLARTMAEAPEAPRRAAMQRVYASLLSALGLGVLFTGLTFLLAYILDLALGRVSGVLVPSQFTASLALILVGLPLWLLTWRPLQAEALAASDLGDHARRSLTRKIYLYLALFAGVIGGMVVTVLLLYALLNALFSGSAFGLVHEVLNNALMLLLFAGLGTYHGLKLRSDRLITVSALALRHAAFPVLIFDPGDDFAPLLLAAIQKTAPALPYTLQDPGSPPPGSPVPSAVVLPSDLALDPPAPLREWLAQYAGARLVVPRPSGKWLLAGLPPRLPASQAAQTLRQLAEAGELHPSATPGWLIVVYILAAVFGLPILVSLLGSILSAFIQ